LGSRSVRRAEPFGAAAPLSHAEKEETGMAKKSVIDLLNEARSRELTAILQYMAQHYELEDQGMGKLGDKMKKVAIEEMKHAETLAERILFIGGVPGSKPDAVAKKGESIPQMLDTDIALEEAAVTMYNSAANACSEAGDQISKQIFEKLLAEEEDHLDLFQTVRDHVDKMGAAYLATLVD
jgi:bacterioferritin